MKGINNGNKMCALNKHIGVFMKQNKVSLQDQKMAKICM